MMSLKTVTHVFHCFPIPYNCPGVHMSMPCLECDSVNVSYLFVLEHRVGINPRVNNSFQDIIKAKQIQVQIVRKIVFYFQSCHP